MSDDAVPQVISQETYNGPTAAQARMQQLGAQYRPDRSSTRRHVFYLPDRQIWGSIELNGGQYLVGFWTACPCALG